VENVSTVRKLFPIRGRKSFLFEGLLKAIGHGFGRHWMKKGEAAAAAKLEGSSKRIERAESIWFHNRT
jgi:hypothetical protein